MKRIKKKEGEQEEFAVVCKALAHPIRLQILNHLQEAKGCLCGSLVDKLPLAQSTVSQHLKILKEAELVKGSIDGPRTCYCLNKEKLEEFKKMVGLL